MRFADILMVAATAPGGPPAVTDADAILWIAAVVTNGGTVSASRGYVVESFIVAEKAAGTWALSDDYWGLWGENAAQALTSLKQRRLATVVATTTFAADRGYTGDAVSGYINTGFTPSTNAVAASTANIGMGVYVRTDVGISSQAAAGGSSSSNRIFRINMRSGTTLACAINTSSTTFTLPAATDLGYTTISRKGALATDTAAYKNGAALVRLGTPVNVGTSLPGYPLAILAHNNAGTVSGFCGAQIGFVRFGAALTAAQELAQYNNVQSWATAIGAQV